MEKDNRVFGTIAAACGISIQGMEWMGPAVQFYFWRLPEGASAVKNTRNKRVVMGLCLLLLFALASCTTAPGSGTRENIEVSAAGEDRNSMNAGDREGDDPVQAVEAGPNSAFTVTQSEREWIERYNEAGSALSCSRSVQTLTSGSVWAGSAVSVDLLSSSSTELRKKAENDQDSGIPLTELSASDVLSVQEQGCAVTFRLKEITLSMEDIRQGSGGYINLIDGRRTAEVIDAAKEYFHIPKAGVKLNSVTHTLRSGCIQAVFSSDFTRLESVKFTGIQHAEAEISYLLTVHASLTYQLGSEYGR